MIAWRSKQKPFWGIASSERQILKERGMLVRIKATQGTALLLNSSKNGFSNVSVRDNAKLAPT
jgi:hypothetical protein